MFVKIKKGPKATVYECASAQFSSQNGMLRMTLESDRGEATIFSIGLLALEAIGVYLMNDQGKTIDTIFSKPDTSKS